MDTRPTALRVRRHREALRAAGLRPVQIWVPDSRRPGFALECARQCRAVRGSIEEEALQRWLEGVADTEGWR